MLKILVSTLTKFPTHELLKFTLVSHRFHHLVLRILHFRLLVAAEAPEYKIILEAYLPSRRYTRPYLFCTYLGTDGLSSSIEGEGSLYRDCEGAVGGRLERLSGLYSRFRPEYPAEEGKMPIRRIAGAAPNLASNTAATDWLQTNQPSFDPRPAGRMIPSISTDETQGPMQTQPIFGNQGDGGARKVIYTINLDADELFGQFCIAGSLVKLGPRRGVFLSTVPIVEDKQGYIRVFRSRLLSIAKKLVEMEQNPAEIPLTKTSTDLRPEDIVHDPSILWTSNAQKNVGLRLAVREKPIAGIEQRSLDDEKDDIPVSFDVEILGRPPMRQFCRVIPIVACC